MIKNECNHAYKLLDHAECLWCENCVEKLVKRLNKKLKIREVKMEKITKDKIDKKLDELEGRNPGLKLFRANFEMIYYLIGHIKKLEERIKKLEKPGR